MLLNPGCEDELVGGNIPHWVEVVGTNWTQRNNDPSPQEGNYYFFAGVGATAELRQDVDISTYWMEVDAGIHVIDFSGWVRSWHQTPADISRVVLEYLNSDKTIVLGSNDLGQHTNTDYWHHLTHSSITPIGCRFVRVRLISVRQSGNNNDGYFDGLELSTSLVCPAQPSGLRILIMDQDVLLDWDPVSLDTFGNPLSVDRYDVYAGDTPDFLLGPDTLAGSSVVSDITLVGWAPVADSKFFRVIAVKNY
jgi:hypothetical protein